MRLSERAESKYIDPPKSSDKPKTTKAYHSQIQANEKVRNNTGSSYSAKQSNCCTHQKQGVTHTTENWQNFLGLSIDEKYEPLNTCKMCFKCLNRHEKGGCIASKCSKFSISKFVIKTHKRQALLITKPKLTHQF